jgi:hypothetical protein
MFLFFFDAKDIDLQALVFFIWEDDKDTRVSIINPRDESKNTADRGGTNKLYISKPKPKFYAADPAQLSELSG